MSRPQSLSKEQQQHFGPHPIPVPGPQPASCHLLRLPTELHVLFAKAMEPRDLSSFTRTCRLLNNTLWSELREKVYEYASTRYTYYVSTHERRIEHEQEFLLCRFYNAIVGRRYHAVRAFLEAGVDPNGGRGDRDPCSQALLHLVEGGDLALAELLLQFGADPNAMGGIAHSGRYSPLVLAVGKLHYDMAQLLLEHGADPSNGWHCPRTKLPNIDLAAGFFREEMGKEDGMGRGNTAIRIIDLLLSHGARFGELDTIPVLFSDGFEHGRARLQRAIRNGTNLGAVTVPHRWRLFCDWDLEMLEVLVDLAPELLGNGGHDAWSSCHQALLYGRPDVALSMIRSGCYLAFPAVLCVAILGGYEEVVEVLLQRPELRHRSRAWKVRSWAEARRRDRKPRMGPL
ncbi:ankyrin repeat domain-containing protein [Aspergillus homomorphus CBS 101889]|uniref:Uncharacterized protein n=1 Tax=Aspergillus homomorphus (strain CBS 101889) TaxID=1450537 RepID=A0A395HYA3_ASPHC|nr:hypothetical protein BO97DRAFT_48360 [Aspergillus homomorphus CBS 101889]RAL12901.1 hypothetical protein BO97DRAFT_48360 [Aspergillus homomorphus CBS 101889]